MHPDLRDKKPFWQRKPGCVKAGMLLLAHMERSSTDATLVKDRRFVLNRSAALLAEMANLSALPRPPLGYGWLAPLVGSIEFLQQLIQVRALGAPVHLRLDVVRSCVPANFNSLSSTPTRQHSSQGLDPGDPQSRP